MALSMAARRWTAPAAALAALGGAAAALTAASAAGSPPRKADTAIAILGPLPGQPDGGVRGTVTFKQARDSNAVTVTVKASGLKPGKHGFHVHALGDLSKGCASAGGHFNPTGAPHGGREDGPVRRHVGDLGNIEADEKGAVAVEITDQLISLRGNARCIIGRSIIIHADEDDLGRGNFPDSKTTGHSGARVACGVIGLGEEAALE
jgi:Cu-Zn family superoxide dismutase